NLVSAHVDAYFHELGSEGKHHLVTLAAADHRGLPLIKLLQGIRGHSFRYEFPVFLEDADAELLEESRKVFGSRRCRRARLAQAYPDFLARLQHRGANTGRAVGPAG